MHLCVYTSMHVAFAVGLAPFTNVDVKTSRQEIATVTETSSTPSMYVAVRVLRTSTEMGFATMAIPV
jgi:hypothetical protein